MAYAGCAMNYSMKQGVNKCMPKRIRPEDLIEFVECDACHAKPGSPVLCGGCIYNRDLIEQLKMLLTQP